MIIKYIIPVICGMLVSTALSLLRQASSVLTDQHINPFLSIGIVLAIFLVMLFLHRRFRANDVTLLLLGGIGALTALGIFDHFA